MKIARVHANFECSRLTKGRGIHTKDDGRCVGLFRRQTRAQVLGCDGDFRLMPLPFAAGRGGHASDG